MGIQHDVVDDDGAVWIKIERLQRESPPGCELRVAKWLVTSRDPTNTPQPREAILETMTPAEAQDLVSQGHVDAQDVMPSAQGDSSKVDVRIRLDYYPEIETGIRDYVSGPWRVWSEKEKIRRETIAIYDRFFATIQSIETEGADNPVEVVLGVGMAAWQIKGKTVEHPLVESLVELDIDQQTHAIRVRPRDTDPQLYLRAFIEIGSTVVPQLQEATRTHFIGLMADEGQSGTGFSPFAPASFQPILEIAASRLSSSGVYAPQGPSDRSVPKATEILTVTDTWAIYVRPRGQISSFKTSND